MTNEIKNCYDFLQLPYDATIEQLESKEQELTKKYMKETSDNGIDHDKDIAFVKLAKDKVYRYMVDQRSNASFYNAKWSDIGTMLFILAMLFVSVVACLLALVL